jgi:mono/diheme cytochrome c family protein
MRFNFRLLCLTGVSAAHLIALHLFAADSGKDKPGLAVTFTAADGKAADADVVPNLWLFVEAGKSPSPFLPPGKFTAVYEGTVTAELRGDFFFQADLGGSLKLEINGAPVLEAGGENGATSAMSKSVRLKKGPNKLRATFTSPAKGDAILRLGWSEKGKFTAPIPLNTLAWENSPPLEQAQSLHVGRELFLEHRCAKCHALPSNAMGVPELKMDAPSFEGIGARRNSEWLSRWILDPKSIRPMARMPRMLHGEHAKEDAIALAAFLASLKNIEAPALSDPKPWSRISGAQNKEGAEVPAADSNAERKPFFETLHCVACHNLPDGKEEDPKKIPLKHVAEKFPAGKLAEFLRAPEANFAWIRMPNFRLTSAEANEVSDYLLKSASPPKEIATPEAALVENGKRLLQSSGCLQCHTLKLENKLASPDFSQLAAAAKSDPSKKGDCLGATPFADFSFTSEEKSALKKFLAQGAESLSRHVPAEFAARQTRELNCTACHGQVEGFPPLEILGGKLKPEWMAQFIGGDINYKPRQEKHPRGEPWLEMRMPAFKSRARHLAQGLSEQHGFAPTSPSEPPVNQELAKLGQKLVGKDGGFSCISCHSAGALEATEVFESEGINLAYSADRLLPQYYRRWVRNPLAIDPQTKMPVYFEDGKSPLTDVLDGDAEKQIDAVWQYLRLGLKMPIPSTGAQ